MSWRARIAASAAATLAVALGGAPAAHGAFGFQGTPEVAFTDSEGNPAMAAGTHPFALSTEFRMNTAIDPETGKEVPEEEVRDVEVELPAGMVGNPGATPRCSNEDFLDIDAKALLPACPDASAVGIAEIEIGFGEPAFLDAPVYNLHPGPGMAAKLGFIAISGLPVTVELRVNEAPPYNVIARVTEVPQAAYFYGSRLITWGNPASPAHDALRGSCLDTSNIEEGVFKSLGNCPVSNPEKPFITLPRSCEGEPLATRFRARSWQNPDTYATAEAESGDGATPPGGVSECGALGFGPLIGAQPSAVAAESPTGLDFELSVDDPGLSDPAGTAHSDISATTVLLPEGMSVNPSQAEGLQACTEAQLAWETASSLPGEGCPEAAKVGSLEVETPLLEGEILTGSLYVAEPYANPTGSLIALYMTIKSARLGVGIELAGAVSPDPLTGRLSASFEDLPQLPFSEFRLRFRDGPRAPLVSPPACGTYLTQARLLPSGDPGSAYETSSAFSILTGIGGGPCPPPGPPPLSPAFWAGTTNNAAGSYSPFTMRITRADGEQELSRVSATLAPGLLAGIAGLGRCPEAAIAAAGQRPGLAERAAPSCPPDSRIGRVLAGAGVSPELTYVPGQIYLAGPYRSSPLSVVAITPALAGPFDLGTVVVRLGLDLDPDTGVARIDGASDPFPRILQGVPLRLRDLRVYADRPGFTLNATSCDPTAVLGTVFGGAGAAAPVSSRYQAASCASLGFGPRLRLWLRGKTRRAANPAFRAELRTREGNANLEGAVITLPPSQFIDNDHLGNPCTRVQFAAEACPRRSVLGSARAFSPLLDEPLEGTVYFRANGGERPLPDVVVDLRGQFRYTLVIAVLSNDSGRVKTRVLNAPDAPVSRFVLNLAGGARGLLENSENLCSRPQRANLRLIGQNGKVQQTRPRIKVACGARKAAKITKRR